MGQRPHYVNTLKNKNEMDAVCKICISAHSLMIERGRYFNINKNERHCPICKTGQVEDENNLYNLAYSSSSLSTHLSFSNQ
jgi:rubrerythrin